MHTPTIATLLETTGGFASYSDVRAAGISRAAITSSLTSGTISRIRRGIFGAHDCDPTVARAVRVGGALASISAAKILGIWSPLHRDLHVSIAPDAHHLKHPDDSKRVLSPVDDVILLRDSHHLHPIDERWLVSPVTCLAQALRSETLEFAVAMLDSALLERRVNGRVLPPLVTRRELEIVVARTPLHLRAAFGLIDARAEAGSESIARVRLMLAGILATPQVWVTDHIRVDLLIGDRLVIEIGSFRYHGNAAAYERDHERLATLHGLGFVVLEFTYHQVMSDWETVLAVICAAMERGDHRTH